MASSRDCPDSRAPVSLPSPFELHAGIVVARRAGHDAEDTVFLGLVEADRLVELIHFPGRLFFHVAGALLQPVGLVGGQLLTGQRRLHEFVESVLRRLTAADGDQLVERHPRLIHHRLAAFGFLVAFVFEPFFDRRLLIRGQVVFLGEFGDSRFGPGLCSSFPPLVEHRGKRLEQRLRLVEDLVEVHWARRFGRLGLGEPLAARGQFRGRRGRFQRGDLGAGRVQLTPQQRDLRLEGREIGRGGGGSRLPGLPGPQPDHAQPRPAGE